MILGKVWDITWTCPFRGIPMSAQCTCSLHLFLCCIMDFSVLNASFYYLSLVSDSFPSSFSVLMNMQYGQEDLGDIVTVVDANNNILLRLRMGFNLFEVQVRIRRLTSYRYVLVHAYLLNLGVINFVFYPFSDKRPVFICSRLSNNLLF